MSERLKGSEDIRQPEVIQLDQEFFPLRNIFISVDTFRGYNISEKYYELPIPGNHLSINVESQIGGFEHQNPLAIRPFGEGYRIDQEDFDLKTRKAKITDIVRSSKAKSDLDNLWLCVYINSCYAKLSIIRYSNSAYAIYSSSKGDSPHREVLDFGTYRLVHPYARTIRLCVT